MINIVRVIISMTKLKLKFLILMMFSQMKNCKKIFSFITFQRKDRFPVNLCALDSIKQVDFLEFIMEQDIKYYWQVKNIITFATELGIQLMKKVMLRM